MKINDANILSNLQGYLKDDIYKLFNDIGRRPDNHLDLSFILGSDKPRYPKFAGNLIRNSEFDVKH